MRDRIEVAALAGVAVFAVTIGFWAATELWHHSGPLFVAIILGILAAILTFTVEWITSRP